MRYLISILGLAAIVGAGYFSATQFAGTAHGQMGLPAVSNSDSVSADGAQVLALLGRLKGIKLDGAIFETDKFKSLQDWSVEIPPQTISRPNPFLPTYTAPAVGANKAPLLKAKK